MSEDRAAWTFSDPARLSKHYGLAPKVQPAHGVVVSGSGWQFLLFHVERLHQPMQVVRVQAEAPGRLRVAAAGLIECVRH